MGEDDELQKFFEEVGKAEKEAKEQYAPRQAGTGVIAKPAEPAVSRSEHEPAVFHGTAAPQPPPKSAQHQEDQQEHQQRDPENEMPTWAPPNHPSRATSSKPDQVPGNWPRAGEGATYRHAAGQRWKDPTLAEWPENDYRIFVGNLGPETNDEILSRNFSQYKSFAKARVVRDGRTGKSRGYGFVSLLDSHDYARALREMHGRYVGNRVVQLKKCKSDNRRDPTPPSVMPNPRKRLHKRKHIPGF